MAGERVILTYKDYEALRPTAGGTSSTRGSSP